MIITALVIIIVVLAIKQNNNRQLIALIFAMLTLTHEVAFRSLPGFHYFFTAALIDSIIIMFILALKYNEKLTNNLYFISLMFIVWNMTGWIMWENWISPSIYENGAAIIYMCAIVSLLNWDGIEDGNYKINRWANLIRMPDNSCSNHVSGLSKEGGR